MPLFDKRTGDMQPAVARYWKEHYDLLEYMKRNWRTLGPKIVDKIHVYTGTMDTFHLNNSTTEMEKWMKTTENPHYEGSFSTAIASRTAGAVRSRPPSASKRWRSSSRGRSPRARRRLGGVIRTIEVAHCSPTLSCGLSTWRSCTENSDSRAYLRR